MDCFVAVLLAMTPVIFGNDILLSSSVMIFIVIPGLDPGIYLKI